MANIVNVKDTEMDLPPHGQTVHPLSSVVEIPCYLVKPIVEEFGKQ